MSTHALPRLLVVGGPDSGKTTYRAQFILRLLHKPGVLKLDKSIGDWTAIDAEVARLTQGLQVLHTNLDVFHSTNLEISDATGRSFVLDFADYGGEQIKRMATSNAIPNAWIDLVRHADAWMVFLRIDKIRPTKSFMSDPVQTTPQTAPPAGQKFDSSTEAGMLEVLQRLLFIRGSSLQYPLASPRLGVMLSCWDEVPDTERGMEPGDLLQLRAPLLAQFLKANWKPEHLQIYALSSTDGPLSPTEPSQSFIDKGPENIGYVRSDQIAQETDLTIPISWLMAK